MHGNSYLRGVLYEEDVVLKRKAVETHESYPVRILDWNVDYSLRLDKDGSLSGGPFWEHCSPELTGEFVGPKKLEGREVRITLLEFIPVALIDVVSRYVQYLFSRYDLIECVSGRPKAGLRNSSGVIEMYRRRSLNTDFHASDTLSPLERRLGEVILFLSSTLPSGITWRWIHSSHWYSPC